MTDLIGFAVILWLIVGTGLVFYFTPVSVGARKMRIIALAAILLCIVFLSTQVSVPMSAGRAFVWIGAPTGGGLRLPYRYGYFILKLWPIFGLVSMTMAAVGPIAYVVKTRADLRHKRGT
ncbi:MAG TPA: hypothetical protein VFO46_07990 [Candidatus Sulfotelmatobacter sp.]|nr:hypothetical protein [Candidatus Sulfotelmatobacter sp.]